MTPIGHALAAVAAGRLLGLRKRRDLGAFAALATLPDADLGVSLMLQGDPMALHRNIGTHSLPAPLLAALAGWALAPDGRRARTAALVGGGVAFHLLTDHSPLPYPKADGTRSDGWLGFAGKVLVASMMDLAVFGPAALAAFILAPEQA